MMSSCDGEAAGGPLALETLALETSVLGESPPSASPSCHSSPEHQCPALPTSPQQLDKADRTSVVENAADRTPCPHEVPVPGAVLPHTSAMGSALPVEEAEDSLSKDNDVPIISTCCESCATQTKNRGDDGCLGQEYNIPCQGDMIREGTEECRNRPRAIMGYYADRKNIREHAPDKVHHRPGEWKATHTTVDCHIEPEVGRNDISGMHQWQDVTGVTINDCGHLYGDEESAAKLDVASINDFSDTSALLVGDELATSGRHCGSSNGAGTSGSGPDSGGCTPQSDIHVGGTHPSGPVPISTNTQTSASCRSQSSGSGSIVKSNHKRKKSPKIDKEKSKHRKTEKAGKTDVRRCASIETIMEFDENFHGDDGGLDSPASDCTSLFSLGSDAEVCLREVMDGLGDTGSLGGCSSTCSTPPLGEATALRWSRRKHPVRPSNHCDKSDYQELCQECDPYQGRGRSHFTVEADGQEYSPTGEAGTEPGHAHGPRVAESSFMAVNEGPAVAQTAGPTGLPNKHPVPSGPGASEGTMPQDCSAELTQQEQGLPQSDNERQALELTVQAQRPEQLNLQISRPTPTDNVYQGRVSPSSCVPSQTSPPMPSAPTGATPGQRCCTCGQTVPTTLSGITDNANNGDSVNSNITAYNERTPSTVIEVQTAVVDRIAASGRICEQGSKAGDSGPGQELVSEQVVSTGTAQTPSYIDALQRETQRCSSTGQSLAPPLHDNLRYHAFFLYHNNDRDWVLNVMEKLESPTLGFKCCCHERDLDCSLSLPQAVLYGMKNSVKTIVVLSPDFVTCTWSSCEVVVSELDPVSLQRDLLLVMLQDCDMPNLVTDMPYIDASKRDWWTKLLATLALPDDTPMTEETVLSMSSSLVGLNPGLQSGHLLHSIKSKCLCCGRELVDPTEVPDELIAHGVQIPPEEYCHAIGQLMCGTKFRCHIWCYNMPVAMLFFTLFLGLCLAIIPIIETKYMFSGTDLTHPSLPTPASKGISVQSSKKQTGLEYVHGAIVWLCVLTLYMLCTHLARRKMKDNTYRSLSQVNTVFVKYNLLVGVENLGLADCNKYYLHFFYFELGPCLAYLQELVDNLEDVNPCYTNQAYLQELLVNLEECTPCYTNQVLETDGTLDMDGEDHDTCANNSERINVLDHPNMTNVSMQTHAEDLLLDHSGEYINMLITKKLDRPRKQRHVKGCYCLCQFVEQRVYKMVV